MRRDMFRNEKSVRFGLSEVNAVFCVTEKVGQEQQKCRISGGSQSLSGHCSKPDRSPVGYSKALLRLC
jgi:hypothetical protein